MTTVDQAHPSIERFTGIAEQFDSQWWALCDQLPIAANGATYNDALRSMIGSIQFYRGALNGSDLPKIDLLPRGNGESPFEVTVALP